MFRFYFSLSFLSLLIMAVPNFNSQTTTITLVNAPSVPSFNSASNNAVTVKGTTTGTGVTASQRRGFIISRSYNYIIAPFLNNTASNSSLWGTSDYLTYTSLTEGIISATGTAGSTFFSPGVNIPFREVGVYYIRSFYKSGTSNPSFSPIITVKVYPGHTNLTSLIQNFQNSSTLDQSCTSETYELYPKNFVFPNVTSYNDRSGVTYTKQYFSDNLGQNPIADPTSSVSNGEHFFIRTKIEYSDVASTFINGVSGTEINESGIVYGPLHEYVLEIYVKPVIDETGLGITQVIEPNNSITIPFSGEFFWGYSYIVDNNSSLPHGMAVDPIEIPNMGVYFGELFDNGGSTVFNYVNYLNPEGGNGTILPGETKYLYVSLYGICFSLEPNYFDNIFIPITRLAPPSTANITLASCTNTVLDVKDYVETTLYSGSGETWNVYDDYDAQDISVGTMLGDNYQIGGLNNTALIWVSYVDANGNESDTRSQVVVNLSNVWTGPNGGQIDDPANWCLGIVPSTPTIPNGTIVYMDGSYDFENITVECGGSLIITSTGRVNITYELNNSGTVQVINGGTIRYGSSTSGTCTGTYKTLQTLQPSRYWYVGPTTTNTLRTDFGSVATTSNPTGTQMWSWNEVSGAYIAPLQNSGYLVPGKGYVYRNLGNTTLDVDVTGPYYTAAVSHNNLMRTGSTALSGFHLFSNPYTAYLDANQILNSTTNTGTTNMQGSIWVRTNSSETGGINSMVFDTYNTTLGSGTSLGWQVGSSLGVDSLCRWIAPMQGFWVRANTNGASLAYNYSMTAANPANAGQLRTTSTVTGLARLNVSYGSQKDQIVVALSPNASNGFEANDSEKMFTSGVIQLYAPNSGKKLAINTLKDNKSKVSVPITVECPGTGWYSFNLAELNLDNGILLLEDKLSGEMKNLSVDLNYSFYANSGVLSNRFILHFHLPMAVVNATGPSSMDELVTETNNAVINIASTGSGKVSVTLDQVEEETNSSVRVCDLFGRVIDTFTTDGKTFEFHINQGQGAYLIEVTNGLTVEKKKIFMQ